MRWGFLFAALLLFYPVLVYLGINHFEPRVLALVLMVLALTRLLLIPGKASGRAGPQVLAALAVALLIGVLSFVSNSVGFLLYYPVCMNLLMFLIFVASLLRPPSMIERFARLTEPNLPDEGVRYTRQVTKVWCIFFIINGSIALYSSVAASMAFWTLYNGGIAYLLMAALFSGEYVFRAWWRRRHGAG
ncbi:hypothetical protein [Pelagibius marinus]|uniref:COG4648 family protein n=1 Tax=Pelagibius marinus TaxID=2762760 RepID=UPI001872370F|nr:hypothetical protein [Pelagibius marinus]